MRISKSFIQQSIKMIGNWNAKELPINSRYNPNRIPNSGDLISIPLKIALNLLKRTFPRLEMSWRN